MGGRVEQGRLLGVVVVVVLDVDSCCDPTDDEGDPAGDQIEPAGEEKRHRTPGARGRARAGLVQGSKSRTSPRRCPRGAGAGEGGSVPQQGSGGCLGRVPVRLLWRLPGQLLVEHSGFHRHPEQRGERGVVQDDADLREEAAVGEGMLQRPGARPAAPRGAGRCPVPTAWHTAR